jgi:hypothetical protein
MTKGFKLTIGEIANDKFNTGHNKFADQFTQSRRNVANYLQQMSAAEGYLVAKTVQTGKEQMIALPAPVNANDPDKENLELIRTEEVKVIAKRRLKLVESLKKGYTTVYNQCLEAVKKKLETTDDCDKMQRN